MTLVALIYCETLTGSREWIVIPELTEWAEGCPGKPRRESPAVNAPEALGSRFKSLLSDFDTQVGHSWVDVGLDLHPRCTLTEHVALCDVMQGSKLPTFQLTDKSERSPLGLDWVLEDDGSKSCHAVLDIVTGVDRDPSWFHFEGESYERGRYCSTSAFDLFHERLEVARALVDKWDEVEIAQTMTRWCREWLRFGAWFRKTYPGSEPPPRSESVDEIIEILDAPRLEIWNRHDLGRNFKKKAVQP